MRERLALLLTFLMLASPASALVTGGDYDTNDSYYYPIDSTSLTPSTPAPRIDAPWVESSLGERIQLGAESVRVTVISHSLRELNAWQHKHNQIENQAPPAEGQLLVVTDPTDGVIDHRTFWIDSDIFHKLSGVAGVIGILDAQNSPEPYDSSPLASDDSQTSVRSGEIHGANDAWSRGYSGDGIIVAVADTGIDFAHPDLDGTQARISDGRQYDGWPMMFDHNSMYHWLVNNEAYPERNTWYADTSTLDFDNNSDGVLDISGYIISGVPNSSSGVYHLGEHPDSTLRSQMGGDVPILVIDSTLNGTYDIVIPDINRNGNFSDDERMVKGNETAGLDENGDGVRDVSAGLLYWISDGKNGVPYADVYAGRHGYSNRIAGAGNLTLFMLDSGNHGTLCASAVAAQAKVNDAAVLGMAPNATIASIGNHYSGGHSLDGWRWIAEGNDGDPSTWGDQPHIGSFSFGYSSIDDSGADSYSLYLDWLTRVYNNQTHYAVAIGNGGHGYGTVKVPGAAQGIFSVGAFSSRTNMLWGQSAPWTNRGPNIVGRMDPDIVAVGWSATGDVPLNTRNNGNSATTTWGGTSLATPITAGLLAVVEQAWLENYGELPKSQPFRDFILSTADDRGYDPFVQGGGWFNASRSTAAIDGENGTFSFTPSQWMTGTFQGQHRDANINVIYPGESQTVSFELTNHGESPIHFTAIGKKHQAIDHQVGQWLSIGNGSSGGENNTWDGYQDGRPDLLIPIHVNNTSYQLHPYTNLVRARAVIEYAAFDGDLDRSSDERIELTLYRWSDDDGDGIWVADEDNDSMVDDVDWTESSEFDEYAEWYMHGPQAELRVGLPFDDMGDGLFLGVSRRDVSPSGLENVSIEWDWTAFGSVPDSWISTFHSIGPPSILPANSTISYNFTVNVPLDAEPGLHQHGLVINGRTLPIITNVPYTAPIDITARPLDGNLSNQTLYSESWISGAQRWNWRAESGDWRIMTVDWPEELDTGGTAILDVDWDDNPYTDIDVLWLSQSPHGYSEEDPDAYGDSTFYIQDRSTNNYRSSGRHDWGTFTGDSREVFAVPASPGLNQLVLHTAHHGVTTNDNPLNISVGYVAAEQHGFEKYVTDWSQGSGEDAVHVVSTVPMNVESVYSYGWSQPVYLENETAFQDVTGDILSSSWWYNLSIENSTEIDIRMDSPDDVDLDLYLLRDSNGDGNFSSSEEVARSWSSSSSESIEITNPEDGYYAVAVHGWSVPSGSAQFWIDIDIVGGNQLAILDNYTLNQSEIASLWPNGSQSLAGQTPASAFQVNLSYSRPSHAGLWSGHVEVILEGGISIGLPYTYELVELNPEISFVQPENSTETNSIVPINIHALDTGIGFKLDDLNWIPSDNLTNIPDADLVEALDTELSYHNLTEIWNSGNHFAIPENVSFREVWINATLPEIEQWHRYTASVTDLSNYSSNTHLSVSYDITAPILMLSEIPHITNQENLTYSIYSEPGASITHSGTPVILDENGYAEYTIQLTEAEPRQNQDSTFYYVGGSSAFELVVSDAAGNSFSRELSVIYDPTSPSAQFVDITDQAGYHYDLAALTNPVNLTEGVLSAIIPVDVQEWCFQILSVHTLHEINECVESENMPQAISQDNPGQSFKPAQYNINTTGIPDGEYLISLELIDWAENSATQTWLVSFDSTVPVVDWSVSPGTQSSFFDHRQGLSWIATEEVHVTFTIDGVTISERTDKTGGALFELNRTGMHEVCLEAIDMTEPQENDNRFKECRQMVLESSIYSTHVSANWDGGVMAIDEVEATLQRGPDQEIWWRRADSEQRILIAPGAQIVPLTFELQEGENQFIIEIEALDHFDNYTLSIVRDTIPPVLTMEEIVNRTSTLETQRVISGTCEPNAPVMIWSETESIEFNCNSQGVYEIVIGIPDRPGTHTIDSLTSDSANNENSATIEVMEQDWIDWAIDDARDSGPMLWWFSLSAIVLLLIIVIPTVAVRRRRAQSDRILEQGPDIDDILSEVESSVQPLEDSNE